MLFNFIASIIYCLTNLTFFKLFINSTYMTMVFLRSAYMFLFYFVYNNLFLCTECLVSASEQVFNPDEWRLINAL